MVKGLWCWPALAWLAVAEPIAAATSSWQFTPTGWNPADFILVKSPRWDYLGQWVQKADHLENAVPAGATREELEGKRAPETYTSMVQRQPVTGNVRLATTLAFTWRMAPLMVLAPELGRDAAGRPEYREHFEVCVFNEGVNVWHHTYADGRPSWHLAAYGRFPLQADTRYRLEVERKGQRLTIRIDGHEFGYQEDSLPPSLYVGLTGCEGLNRFYDFSVSTP